MNRNIISLGDDYEAFPREHWGTKDWQRHDALKEMSRRVSSTAPLPTAPLPAPRVNPLSKDVEGDARRRRLEVDRLLEKHGLVPRRRWT